jgi:hypothetical protein
MVEMVAIQHLMLPVWLLRVVRVVVWVTVVVPPMVLPEPEELQPQVLVV